MPAKVVKLLLHVAALAALTTQAAAAAGAWTGADEFTFRLAFTETPRVATLRLRFSETSLSLDVDQIGGFAPRVPTLTGLPADE